MVTNAVRERLKKEGNYGSQYADLFGKLHIEIEGRKDVVDRVWEAAIKAYGNSPSDTEPQPA